ncbi:unnamed protein product, partial [Candidula unifasciata]
MCLLPRLTKLLFINESVIPETSCIRPARYCLEGRSNMDYSCYNQPSIYKTGDVSELTS